MSDAATKPYKYARTLNSEISIARHVVRFHDNMSRFFVLVCMLHYSLVRADNNSEAHNNNEYKK